MKKTDREQALVGLNRVKKVLQQIEECHDMYISDVRELQTAVNEIRHAIAAAPPVDEDREDGHWPDWYADFVLDSDPRAWIYKPKD